MAAAALATAPSGALNAPRWIIGRGVDLALVIGSALAGYLYLILYAGFHVPISLLWWFWSVGFDGTHIFATASRTLFRFRSAPAQSRALLRQPGFFLLPGPAHGAGRLEGLALSAGRRVGLLSRHPPALRLHGSLQSEEPRPGACRQPPRPRLPRGYAGVPALPALLHPPSRRTWAAFSLVRN